MHRRDFFEALFKEKPSLGAGLKNGKRGDKCQPRHASGAGTRQRAGQTPWSRPQTEAPVTCSSHPGEESAGIRFQKDHLGCEGHPFHSVLRQASYLCSQGSASVLPVARCGCAVPFCIVPRREETDSFSLSPDFSAKILVIPRGNFRVEITCSPSYLLLWESVGDEEAPRFASALAEGSGGTLW